MISVGVAQPTQRITSVGNAQPTQRLVGVGNANGTQYTSLLPKAAPAAAPRVTTTTGGSSGGGGGVSSAAAPIDPYAAWGGKARYDTLVRDYNAANGTAMNSISDNENNNANQFHSSILDYLDGLRSGQSAIDSKVVNNELAKKQGSDSILDMVSHGIRSSGVQLAHGNAGSSSAAEQLAQAWGENGRQSMATIDNQYELGKNSIGSEQGQFDASSNTNLRHINENKSTIVNSIINDAVGKLADLNSKASTANLPQRIDINAQKARIQAEAMGKLQAFDGELNNGRNSVHQIGDGDAKAKAFQLAEAGKAADNPFKVDSVLPVNLPTAGAPGADMPLFTLPKKDNQ